MNISSIAATNNSACNLSIYQAEAGYWWFFDDTPAEEPFSILNGQQDIPSVRPLRHKKPGPIVLKIPRYFAYFILQFGPDLSSRPSAALSCGLICGGGLRGQTLTQLDESPKYIMQR